MPVSIFYRELVNEIKRFDKGALVGFKYLQNLDNLTLDQSCQQAVSAWFHSLNRYHRADPRGRMPVLDTAKDQENALQADHFLAEALSKQNIRIIHCICTHFGGSCLIFEDDYYKNRSGTAFLKPSKNSKYDAENALATALLYALKYDNYEAVEALMSWVGNATSEPAQRSQLLLELLVCCNGSSHYRMIQEYQIQLSKQPKGSLAFQVSRKLNGFILEVKEFCRLAVPPLSPGPALVFSPTSQRPDSPRDLDSAMLRSPTEPKSLFNELGDLQEDIKKLTL